MLKYRLCAISEMVIPGKPAADIGADHAQLAVYLAETSRAPKVIIGELGDGPFQRATTAVRQSGAVEKIELRQGDGLEVLDFHEVNTVVLAGMGGDTIIEILSRDWDKAASFERFVLQPMSKSCVIRQRLASRGWVIENEVLAEERKRLFLVMAVCPGNVPYYLTDLETDIGPILLNNGHRATRLYVQRFLDQYRLIYKEITGSWLGHHHELADYYAEKISGMEEYLDGNQG